MIKAAEIPAIFSQSAQWTHIRPKNGAPDEKTWRVPAGAFLRSNAMDKK